MMVGKKTARTQIIQYFFVVLMCLIILVPIMILVIASFKDNAEFGGTGMFAFAQNPTWDNYVQVLKKANIFVAFKNTTIILVFSVALNVFIGSLLAYVLGRYQFRGKALIFLLIMGARVIPTITTQVATFSVIQKLGLFNSLGAPIILYAGTDVVQTYLYLQFVNSIPRALDESARIDGASPFRIYRSIIFPLLKPATVTVMILKIVAIYNDMYIPYLYLTKNSNSVISTALLKFCGSPYGAQVPLVSAAFVIAMVPMLLLYLFSQRFLFDGITAGAVKG